METIKNIEKNSCKKMALWLAVFLLLSAKYGMSQRGIVTKESSENFGFSTSMIIAADGYGPKYVPSLFYKTKRNTFLAGPVIQSVNSSISGAQVNYQFTIAGKDAVGNECYNENLEFFGFVSAAYYYNAVLGKHAIWEEHMANRYYEGDVSKLHFQSTGVYAGVGLKLTIFKNFKFINSVGFGGYKSFHFPPHLYYNEYNAGLTLRTGFSYDFNK